MSRSMLIPEQTNHQRCTWFEVAERLGNVTRACERCGISRKTFYKWRTRFQAAQGRRAALLDRSRRPHRPRRRVNKTLRGACSSSGSGPTWSPPGSACSSSPGG